VNTTQMALYTASMIMLPCAGSYHGRLTSYTISVCLFSEQRRGNKFV